MSHINFPEISQNVCIGTFEPLNHIDLIKFISINADTMESLCIFNDENKNGDPDEYDINSQFGEIAYCLGIANDRNVLCEVSEAGTKRQYIILTIL